MSSEPSFLQSVMMRVSTTAAPSVVTGLLAAILLGAAGHYLWVGTHGTSTYATEIEVLALVLFLAAFTSFLRAWRTFDERSAALEASRRAKQDLEKETTHGRARFATLDDAKGAGMLKNPKGTGIFLARLEGKNLYHNKSGSVLVLAPPGMGKTTALAINHGLNNTTSSICIDPKGELYVTTAKARRRMGHRVWVISPWSEQIREQSGGKLDIPDGDGFDPIAWLDPSAPGVIDDASLVAKLLLPDRAPTVSDSGDYFRRFGREVVVAFALYALARDRKVTLMSLRALLMASPEAMDVALADMMVSESFSGVLAELANRISGTRADAPKEWASALSTAISAVSWADAHSPLGRSVQKNEVDWSRFYEKPTTVYIIAPPDAIATYGDTWLAACITVAQELLVRARRPEKITFLVDEFQALGRQEALLRGLALYRAFARYVFCVQYISALERVYGPSWREFLGCEVVMAFGATSDHATLKLLSDLAGTETVTAQSFSEQDGGFSSNTGLHGRPLLNPEDIRTLPDGKALIFAGTLPPMIADKAPYYTVPSWRRKAGKNPYK